MKITTTQTPGKSTLRLEGDLLIACVADAKPALLSALAGDDDIALDLSQVTACDTAGMQLLLMARASVRARGKAFGATAQSEAFQTAVDRVGVARGCFESHEGTP